MPIETRRFIGFMLLACSVAVEGVAFGGDAPTTPPTAAAPDAAQLVARLSDWLDEASKADRFSGVVLLALDGNPVLERAYGMADRATARANRADTRFNLGSINKVFTSIAIRQLAAAGKLDLDAPLLHAWPDYPDAQIAATVTPRQMLEHRSGIAGDIFATPPGRTRDELAHNRDFLPLVAGRPLAFEPGTEQRYSNAGYVVLGALVERVSGEDYYDYVRKHVFEPAGMTYTAHHRRNALPANTAIGYTRGGHGAPASDPSHANTESLPGIGSAAGGGYSTAQDLLAFLAALRAGRIVEGPPAGLRAAGGAPGINAVIEGGIPGGYDLIVLANLDPPAAEAVARALRGWIGMPEGAGPNMRPNH